MSPQQRGSAPARVIKQALGANLWRTLCSTIQDTLLPQISSLALYQLVSLCGMVPKDFVGNVSGLGFVVFALMLLPSPLWLWVDLWEVGRAVP